MKPYYEDDAVTIYHGDCLDYMKEIPDGSVDMVLTDPPYGTTVCKWDSIILLEPMWEQLKRVIKSNGAIVMTASQPFTTTLIASNMSMFKYCWVWEKSRATGYFDVQYRPMKSHEDVCVFGFGGVSNRSNPKMNYYPQGLVELSVHKERTSKGIDATSRSGVKASGKQKFTNFPKTILRISSEGKAVHPTQKPVALFEYLIKTYTNEGETVLDFAMGSGTTGVAAKNLNRKAIGIEIEEKYCEIAAKRMAQTVMSMEGI